MRVSPLGDGNRTSRFSRLVFVLSIAAVAAIIVCAFAVFPEDASPVDEMVREALEESNELVTGSSQGDATNTPLPHNAKMKEMLSDYMQTTKNISAKYDKRIEAVVAEDTMPSEHVAHNQSLVDAAEIVALSIASADVEGGKHASKEDDEHDALAAYEEALSSNVAANVAPKQDHFEQLMQVNTADDPATASTNTAQAAAAAQAQAHVKAQAERAKEALKEKIAEKKKKMKAKTKKKLKDLAKRKKEHLKKTKERRLKEAVATVRLKNTGMDHLKMVIQRGKARVNRRYMRAQAKVYKQVGHSIDHMQETSAGHAAIKAARNLRRKAQVAHDEYAQWKLKKQADMQKQIDDAKNEKIEDTYRRAYRDLEAADKYHDALHRINDDRVASLAHRLIHGDAHTTAADDADADAPPMSNTKGVETVSSGVIDNDSPSSSDQHDTNSDGQKSGDKKNGALLTQFDHAKTDLHQVVPSLQASIAEAKAEAKAEKDASNTDFIPRTRHLPPAAQRKSHVVHARPSPKHAKGQATLSVKLHPLPEEDHDGQPNNHNPIGAPVQGVNAQAKSATLSTHPPLPAKIAGENRAPAAVDQGAIIHDLNEQDFNNTKRHIDSELKAKEKARQALRAKKHHQALVAWHKAQREGAKRSLPLVQKLAHKYKDKHWSQVWNAFEHRKELGNPSARQREHLVHPNEKRTGNMGAQGIPRVKNTPSAKTESTTGSKGLTTTTPK